MPTSHTVTKHQREASFAASLGILVAAVATMVYLRFQVFPDRFLTLSYNVPLLLCLWHRDLRLLWAMAISFLGISAYKALTFMSASDLGDDRELTQWMFQVCNIIAGAVAVHLTIKYGQRLAQKHAELELANEELNQQAEELAQQNEEIRTQAEELEQQNEELGRQTEELTAAQVRAAERETMLQALLNSVPETDNLSHVLEITCDTALKLLGGSATAVAIVEKHDCSLSVRAQSGIDRFATETWPYHSSFTAVVMEQGRTAFISNLARRPDLVVPCPKTSRFASVLGTPMLVGGRIAGAVEAYSLESRQWHADDFAVLEWVADQAALVIDARASREKLEELVRDRTAQLQAMINELQHFSYTITHDMRAPLRSLQGFAAMLRDPAENLTESQRADYLARIVTSAGRMDQLITDALSYNRAVQEQIPLEPVNTAELLDGILKSYPSLQPPHAEIEIEGGLPVVLANGAGLTQCFANLLTNAVKFVAPGNRPRVRIYAKPSKTRSRICVHDNGIGIPEQMRPKLFHMFQRASREYEGTGIGLALVRKVTERMGGRVGFDSQPGQGACFWIDLQLPPTDQTAPPVEPHHKQC